MHPHQPVPAEPVQAEKRYAKKNVRMLALGAALLGMLFGGTVEYFVGVLFDSTGWFGPTMESLVQAQDANFQDIRAKLQELKKAPSGSPESARLQGDLKRLLVEQEGLVTRTNTRLNLSEQELTRLRQEMLTSRGSAPGADIYLSPMESVTVHSRGNVFALVADYRNGVIDANLSGTTTRMKPGDFVDFKDGQTHCKVFYKTRNATTGKIGFDLVCEPG